MDTKTLPRSWRKSNDLRDAMQTFRDKLAAMSDHELFKTAKEYIWLSAYAYNNPQSDYHWMCDATYDEAAKRDGGNASIYSRAHKAVSEG